MQNFADTCERISATTKKLEKEKIVAGYLSSLSDDDLAIASRFFCGSPFALRDQRTTNTGFAAVRDALLDIEPAWLEQLGPAMLKTGDPGAAVEQLMKERPLREPSLALQDVLSYYNKLATSITNKEKRDLLRELLDRATPLEAKYILKILLGGMRIGLQESQVETSIAKAFQRPAKDVQTADMLLGDIGETAVLARHDRLQDARMRLLHPIKPMLASPEEDTAKILAYMDGSGYAEDKYDGIRAHIHKDGETVRIYSRDLDDITASFPDIVQAISGISDSVLMDGEIVPYRDGKILTFAELQTRLGRKELSDAMLAQVPCRYFAFDVLFSDGELLLSQPLRQRKEFLHKLHSRSGDAFLLAVSRVVQTAESIETAFEESRSRNNEGLVIKHPESEYSPGKRGKTWLKLKRALLTLDVVVVAAEYGHGKRAGLLSDYTFAVQDQGKLLTIGKAYSGITDVELNRLNELFHQISIEHRGHMHVVEPQVVFEVTFDRINRSNRHTSGFALRFPRIKNIRWDKKPDEIDTLETVESLFNQHFAVSPEDRK